jgi:hypothetical protein
MFDSRSLLLRRIEMIFLRECRRPLERFRGRVGKLIGIVFVGALLGFGIATPLVGQSADRKPSEQSTEEPSLAERLKVAERERDELKKRNAELESRLKQLQSTVDGLVNQALGDHAAAATELPPPVGMIPRRAVGPYISQFRPMFSPFNGMPDPVELAVLFSDAIADKEAARPALDAVKFKLGRGSSAFDVDAATTRLLRADRKVRLLRKIISTARSVAADDATRMQRLGAVHAVSVAEVRNAAARLKMLDEILAADPEASEKPANTPDATEPK